ncbi:TIGR00730 family Rossman fold protein [Isosphaeraceae bacterium EP7]
MDPAMPDRPHICVFCGSSRGANPAFVEAARAVGTSLATRGIGLVYGGGRVGLMGEVADATLTAGGRVVGVIPEALSLKEISHEGLTELHVVRGMHERKALMAARPSAFLTLPGGIGTYEEFFEILTWAALGLHRRPIAVLNIAGYFDPLLALLDAAVDQRFLRPEHRRQILVLSDPHDAVDQLLTHVPEDAGPIWKDLEQS